MNYYENFAQFSWLKFAVIAVAYTLLVFTPGSFRSGVVIFRKNGITWSKISLVHLSFLVVLLAVTGSAAAAYPHLPSWMTLQHLTNRYGWESSEFGIMTEGAILVIAVVELVYFRRQIAMRRETPQ